MVNHSAVGKITKIQNEMKMKSGEVKLYISTSVMLLGIDLPRVDLIVITRPFSHISSVIQAAGRGGRLLKDGTRRLVAIYLLYNATDIRCNAMHITKEVRKLYEERSCIRKILFDFFSSKNDQLEFDKNWCCNSHF